MQERKGGHVICYSIDVNEENVPFEVFGPILDFVYAGTVQYHLLPIELVLKVFKFPKAPRVRLRRHRSHELVTEKR